MNNCKGGGESIKERREDLEKLILYIPLITLNFSLSNVLDVGSVPAYSLTCIEVCAIAHCYCSCGATELLFQNT